MASLPNKIMKKLKRISLRTELYIFNIGSYKISIFLFYAWNYIYIIIYWQYNLTPTLEKHVSFTPASKPVHLVHLNQFEVVMQNAQKHLGFSSDKSFDALDTGFVNRCNMTESHLHSKDSHCLRVPLTVQSDYHPTLTILCKSTYKVLL